MFKDPYLFDFLGTADAGQKHEVEASLVAHVERFLLEFGSGFAFVGRQVPMEVGGDDFKLDLLFYHFKLRRFVVVELKAVKFDPGMVGQLHMYLSAVDDMLKQPDDQPTIGLSLCREKNELVVEYALRDQRRPMGVADWETQLVEKRPDALKGSLPSIEEIEAALAPPERRAANRLLRNVSRGSTRRSSPDTVVECVAPTTSRPRCSRWYLRTSESQAITRCGASRRWPTRSSLGFRRRSTRFTAASADRRFRPSGC